MNRERRRFVFGLCLVAPLAWGWPARPLAAESPATGSPATGSPSAESESRYTISLSGRDAGSESVRTLADGAVEVHSAFNDRGRGPDETTRYTLGADGCYDRLEITGVDYLKNTVAERFERTSGKATWTSASDGGELAIAGASCYLPLENSGATLAVLARALLASPAGRLRILPGGEATIETLDALEVRIGAGEAARRRTIRQVAISGLTFAPLRVWLDVDAGGTTGALFASTDGWQAWIREGWEEAMPQVVAAQQTAIEERERALASRLGRRPEQGFAIVGARLFDAEGARTIPGTTVVVAGDRVAAVGPDGQVPIPDGFEVIAAGGKALVPGLWDLHTHLSADLGPLFLASGITSVRDLGNDTDLLLGLEKRWNAGGAIGPRVVKAGILDGPGPYAGPTKVLVSTVEEVNRAVDRYAELGYEQVKIYSSIDPALVPAIVARARKHGLRISGHVPAFMTAEQAVRAGYDELQHVNFVALNFLFDQVQDTRTPARFTTVAEHAVEIDPAGERFQSFARLLLDKKVALDPTVNVFEEMFLARPGRPSPGYEPILARLPATLRRAVSAGGGLPVPEGKDQRYRDSYRQLLRMVKALWDAGVPIEAGTDAIAGFSLVRELELYVEAGLPTPEVLKLATLGAARITKHADLRGSIAPGKLADLVLVDGDPANRIGDLRRTELTIKGGTIYRAADLWRAVGVAPVE